MISLRLFSNILQSSAHYSLARTRVAVSRLPLPYIFCRPSPTGSLLIHFGYYATSGKPPSTSALCSPIPSTLAEPDLGINDYQDNRGSVVSNFVHLEELRLRTFVSVFGVGAAMLGCFAFSNELIYLLEDPVKTQGVQFIQLAPGEFFFTTLKVSVYSGLLFGSPIILYQIVAFILPLLTKSERRFLGPIVLGSSVLFYSGIMFSYKILTPAALNFLVSNAEGMVESVLSIDRYCGFVFSLMFTTGFAFQVPVIQILLGQFGLVSGKQMLGMWRYVAVCCVVAAAALTPSPDAVTQLLLTTSLLGLYMGGALVVKLSGH